MPLFFVPYFAQLTEEQINVIYRQLITPTNDIKLATVVGPEAGVTKHLLFKQAKTLRERVFARSFLCMVRDAQDSDRLKIKFDFSFGSFLLDEPKSWNLRGVFAAARRSRLPRNALKSIPFITQPTNRFADPELPRALQDLADIIGWEATAAFKDRFYPGIVDIAPLSRDEVLEVMTGMQREMDRESRSRQRVKSDLLALTPERQRALAERRRSWFAKFGITPKTFPTRVFSLWDVSNEPLPEGPKYDDSA